MIKFIMVATSVLALTGGIAAAQTASESTSSTVTQTAVPPLPPAAPLPPPASLAPPPAGTLSSEQYSKKEDGYGNTEVKKSSTYRDSNGVAQDSTMTRTTVPVPPPVVSTTTSSSSTTTTPPQ